MLTVDSYIVMQPHISCRCCAGMEQSAATDHGHFLNADIPTRLSLILSVDHLADRNLASFPADS